MGRVCSLEEAVAEVVSDGVTMAMEGFTHLIPFAVAHEMIRQQRRNLSLMRMTPDLACAYDAGCVAKSQRGLRTLE